MELLRMCALIIIIIMTIPVATHLADASAVLPPKEVEALKQIGKTLGKTWDFSVDPCSGRSGWDSPAQPGEKYSTNSLTCDCTFLQNTVCHVVKIILTQQNLTGILPAEIINLPFLQELDLRRNYLNGTIPREWGTTQLVNISLFANRISGGIPKELGNISTLKSLGLEYNQLSGSIPPELGNLTSIEHMFLTSNNLSGELPLEFGKLINMKEFWIGDNNFMGKIPKFIQNWFNLSVLIVQASGLEGPIPNAISTLTNMIDLRISDLNGIEMTFPNISNLKQLKNLILRSCNLTGPLPNYLSTLPLKTLDLSFNKLIGEIPRSYSNSNSSLWKTKYIYFTENLLSGTVPDWILNSANSVDLTYNNFNFDQSTTKCGNGNINLFASNSSNMTYETASCWRRPAECPRDLDSLHINCGGDEVRIGSNMYEGDTDKAGPANFYGGRYWAFSNTGHFLDDYRPNPSYLALNTSKLSENSSVLSMNGRTTPISLTYYGFCLMNGTYNVKLHFAEITFTNDKTYSSLGTRIFDVYIQGENVLKEFNIEKEAGGAGIEIVKDFQALVTNRTLEIRFHWSGKGTRGIPTRGVYGPVISAISVQLHARKRRISVGAIIGIVSSVVLVIIMILGVLWRQACIKHRSNICQDLKEIKLQVGSFSLKKIKAATNNFDPANKIGEGGFGPVYKGVLVDKTTIAVKKLSSESNQGNREFINEIGMISSLQNPYLVKLYGCCNEGNQLLLVYEYMENNSLARALYGPEEFQINLDWFTRYKICIGIARGLTYLHEESRLKIVHRDIKTTNVLLDKDLNPKISDFGIAKLKEDNKTHISTRITGTYGYMAPEYAMHGYLTDKADVYSFGIVALEIVCGISNTSFRPKENGICLLDHARILKKNGALMDLVDRRLGHDFNQDEALVMINIALVCTNVAISARPAMSFVVSMLEHRHVPENLLLDSDSNIQLMG